MKTLKPLISGIRYSLGRITSVDALDEMEGAKKELIASLKEGGFEHFSVDERPVAEMCVASANGTLQVSGLSADSVGAVVVGNSYSEWTGEKERSLISALYRVGLNKLPIFGITSQACAADGAALRLASQLATDSYNPVTVLVIVFGKIEEMSYVGPQAAVLFSDGAASCLVSSTRGDYEILASESLTNTYIGSKQWIAANMSEYLKTGINDLREVVKQAYGRAGITAKDIQMAFGTNGSTVCLTLIGMAAQLPSTKIYQKNLGRFGHVHACDNWIGIKNYSDDAPVVGGFYLMVSWAPHVVSATIVKHIQQCVDS